MPLARHDTISKFRIYETSRAHSETFLSSETHDGFLVQKPCRHGFVYMTFLKLKVK
jgi:hypothetical protein